MITKKLILLVGFFTLTNLNTLIAQQAYFDLKYLTCFQTTEAGEDEVYFIVNSRYPDGSNWQYRTGSANINDGNNPRMIGTTRLWQGSLPVGSYVDLTILVMELDGGGSDQVIQKAQQIMQIATPIICYEIPPACPYASAVQGVVEFAAALPTSLRGIIQDTDDFIGSISVRIYNNNNYLSAYYYNPTRTGSWGNPVNDPYSYLNVICNFNGDGSNYQFFGISSFLVQ